MKLYLVLMGLPGAGKGTQAHRLCAAFGLVRIATGDLLRAIAREDHELGRRVRDIMGQGRLVDDRTVFEVVKHYLVTAEDTAPGAVLDGYPRNLAQARQLDRYLEERGETDRLHVVFLDVPAEVAVRRLSARWICPQCDRVYNRLSHPSAAGDRCEVDQTPLIQRADDRPEVVRQRLATYDQETRPLLAYYRAAGRLTVVPADRSEAAVFADLRELVARWLNASPGDAAGSAT